MKNFISTIQDGQVCLFSTIKRRARRAARFFGVPLHKGFGGYYFFPETGSMKALKSS